ncbi:MAG: hypothetical protein NTW19_06145 [Planctomycetota bacterium]|nr:hypothetical protein [Planctomycetota bacterium]
MCRLILVGIVVTLAVLALTLYLAGLFLGPWGVAGALVAFVILAPIVLKLVGKRLLQRFAIGLFDSKSRVLRDATAVIHSVTPADAPSIDLDTPTPGSAPGTTPDDSEAAEGGDDEGDDVDDEPARTTKKIDLNQHYYHIDATIKPKPADGKFQHWDLDDLTLVPFDLKIERSADAAESDDETCRVEEVQVHSGGQFAEPEGSKFAGEQRIRLLVSVKAVASSGIAPGKPAAKNAGQLPTRLKFRYYFESFGDIRLP